MMSSLPYRVPLPRLDKKTIVADILARFGLSSGFATTGILAAVKQQI